MVFFAVLFVVGFLGWFIYMIPRSIYLNIQQKKEQQLERESRELMRREFYAALSKIRDHCSEQSTCTFDDRALIFSVSTREKTAYFSTSPGSVNTVPTNKIIGSEIRKNGKTVKANGANEALAGALIAGRTGAVVGAVLAEEQPCVTRYDLVIRLSDVRNSSIVFRIITQDTPENSPTFARAQRFAERVSDIVYAIVNENRTAQRQSEAAPAPSTPKLSAPVPSAPKITASTAGSAIKKVICPNCESVQPIESNFCSNCGQKLAFQFSEIDLNASDPARDDPPETDQPAKLIDVDFQSGIGFCPKCGSKQKLGQDRCTNCAQPFAVDI